MTSEPEKPRFILDEVQRIGVSQAISRVRKQIVWKPGKAANHLAKRIRLGHLPDDASLEEYEAIITYVVTAISADVYLYIYGETIYPTVVAYVDYKLWLVMIGLNGVLETAFPPDLPQSYLAISSFVYLGLVKELDRE